MAQNIRGDRDITGKVTTTDPVAVAVEIRRILEGIYQKPHGGALERAFADVSARYSGQHPDCWPCDTSYHDLQHVLDVALTMSRLMDGYERGRNGGAPPLPEKMFVLAVIVALYHDIGYLRRRGDRKHRYGAEYTRTHVGRGSRFLREHMGRMGMGRHASLSARLIHFTGYERPVESIRVGDALHRRLGDMLGTADIIAQMSDRCYLEKCRDRLYPEFVLGGLARRQLSNGNTEAVFSSGEDLVRKTPRFYRTARHRLDAKLGHAYRYAEKHFGGDNPYMERIERNVGYVEKSARSGRIDLRRSPPWTLAPGVVLHPVDAAVPRQ